MVRRGPAAAAVLPLPLAASTAAAPSAVAAAAAMSGVHHMRAPLRQHAQRPGCQHPCVPASERAGLMLPPRARLPVSATASRLSMPAPPLTPHLQTTTPIPTSVPLPQVPPAEQRAAHLPLRLPGVPHLLCGRHRPCLQAAGVHWLVTAACLQHPGLRPGLASVQHQ